MSDTHIGHFKLHIHAKAHKEDIKGDIFLDADKKCFTAHVLDGFYRNHTASTAKEAVTKAITDFVTTKI